jgi:hypothetical protein
VWVHHNFVYDPDFLSPSVLPKKMRDDIHTRFGNIFPDWKISQLSSLFGGADKPEHWEKAKNYTRSLDKIRNQNFERVLSEFKNE